MGKIFYNKLVRDRIKEKIESKGELCDVRKIEDDSEFEQELLKKIAEEAGALARARTREEFLQEYADLMVVLDALTAHLEFSEADLKTAMTQNIDKKGFYKLRHFLHWSEDKDYRSNESVTGTQ